MSQFTVTYFTVWKCKEMSLLPRRQKHTYAYSTERVKGSCQITVLGQSGIVACLLAARREADLSQHLMQVGDADWPRV